MSIDLSVKLGRLLLQNPVLAASGTFGYGDEYKRYLDVNKLGGIITKTLTLKPKIGNKPPRIAETSCGMLNSIGLENIGLEAFLKEKLPKLKKLRTAVIVSIAGESTFEFSSLAKELACSKSIKALELNMSCPNINDCNEVYGKNVSIVGETLKAVRTVCGLPIITKLSPNVPDLTGLANAALANGSDCITVCNTFIGMAVDIKKRRPKISNVTAGYSGPGIKPMALKNVWAVIKNSKIPVIASGGIMNASDALEFLITGASAIEVGSAHFVNPRAGLDILGGLKAYMLEYEAKHVTDIIGSLKC